MRRRRRYEAAFVGVIAIIALIAGYTFWVMQHGASTRSAEAAVPPLEVGDGFTVRNVASIRPTPEAYAAFADGDRAWRASVAARFTAMLATETSGAPWRPSAEQQLDDSVFVLSGSGRYGDAAALLEEWVNTHPADAMRRVSLARLLGMLGRPADAFPHYELALRLTPNDYIVRAEYAGALLWSRRYAESANQYRMLIAANAGGDEARLGLARALLWGSTPHEAEPLLAQLWAETPGDTTVRGLLRTARATIEPTSTQAVAWLETDAAYAPYRLALARALAREGRNVEAARLFETLVAATPTTALMIEAAGVLAAASDSVGTARMLALAVQQQPSDRALRLRYAQALAWSGGRYPALAEYTRLIAERDGASLRLARGELYLLLGDESSALADLERSAALEPSYEALAAIGDLYRWRGDFARSRTAYRRALALRPRDQRVVTGLALVSAAERAALAQGADAAPLGWSMTGGFVEDNVGFLLMRARLSNGFEVGRRTSASIGAEQLRISHRSPTGPERFVTGYTLGATVQHFIASATHVSVGAGIARHALVRDIMYGHIAASHGVGPVMFTMRVATAPAYEELWSLWTLVRRTPDAVDQEPLRTRMASLSATAPVGAMTVEVRAEQTRISDGNTRTGVSVSARQPVSRSVRFVYSAGTLGYSGVGSGYWTPERYTSVMAGVEVERALSSKLTVAGRATAGAAVANDRLLLAPGIVPPSGKWVGQYQGSVDATYRGRNWELNASGGYGQGARGSIGETGYRSLNGSIRVRVDWP
jgi:tetratricopeptide (TPR) repeat protein